ncbi:hypothetical protein ABTC57_19190, partial [Acinetobacter baumannii]
LDSELVRAINELHDDSKTKQTVLQLMQKQEEFNRANGLPMPDAVLSVSTAEEEVESPQLLGLADLRTKV